MLDKSTRVFTLHKPLSCKLNLFWAQKAVESSRMSCCSSTWSVSSPDPLPWSQRCLANGGLALCPGWLHKALRVLLIWTKAALSNTGITPRSHRQKKPSPDRILLSHDGAFLHGKSVRIVRFQMMACLACWINAELSAIKFADVTLERRRE